MAVWGRNSWWREEIIQVGLEGRGGVDTRKLPLKTGHGRGSESKNHEEGAEERAVAAVLKCGALWAGEKEEPG